MSTFATFNVVVRRGQIVPESVAERVAWLDTHKVPPPDQTCACTAPLALWARAEFLVDDDGSIRLHYSYGSASHEVESGLVARLARLARSTDGRVPETADVSAQISEILEERASRAAAAAAEREEAVFAWLALPYAQQVRREYVSSTNFAYVVDVVDHSLRDDPRVVAHRDALAGYCREREAEDVAAAAARIAPALAAARDYVVSHVPEFARAARDGKDVRGPAVRALGVEVRSWLAEAGLTVVDHYDVRDQDLPRTLAYERLDQARAAVSDRAGDHPLIKAVECSIMRADLCSDRDDRNWRTCVVVDVTTIDELGELEDVAVCAEESCDGREED